MRRTELLMSVRYATQSGFRPTSISETVVNSELSKAVFLCNQLCYSLLVQA